MDKGCQIIHYNLYIVRNSRHDGVNPFPELNPSQIQVLIYMYMNAWLVGNVGGYVLSIRRRMHLQLVTCGADSKSMQLKGFFATVEIF